MDEFLILLQAKLDEAKSKGNVNADIKELQNQLDKLKVQVELDPKAAQNLADSIGKLINQKIVISNIGIDTKSGVKSGQDYGKQFSQGVSQGIKDSISVLNSFKKSLENIGMGSKEIDAVANKINNLGVQIETLNQTQSAGKKDSLSVNIAGIDQYGQAIKLTQQYNTSTGELINTINNVSTVQQKAGSATDAFIEKQQKAVASAKNTLSSIESKLNDPNITKSLAGTDFDANGLSKQLERAKNAVTNLGNASRNTFTQAQIDVDKEITELNNLISILKNAEYAATSLRTKDISTIKIDEGNKLETFVQKMEQSGHYTDELKNKVFQLKTDLSNVFDSSSLTNYLNGVSNLQSEFQKVDAIAKTTEKSTKLQTNIDAEKKILQVYTTELKEAGVLTGDVKAKIQEMFHSLSKVDTQNGLTTWRAELKGVKAETDSVLKSTIQEKSEEEKLANIMASVREKTEQARQVEEQRQQLAQSKIINKAIEDEYKQRQKLADQVNKIQLLSNGGIKNDYSTQLTKLEGQYRNLGLTEDQIIEKTSKVSSALEALKLRINQPFDESNYQEIISLNDKLQKELAESSNEYTKLQSSAKGYISIHQRLTKANAIEAWNQKNSNATKDAISKNEAYIASLRNLNAQMTKMEFEQISRGFKETENSMRGINRLGASLTNQFKEAAQGFSQWLSVSSGVMLVVSQIKNSISEIKELDDILTEISKTSDLTTKELKQLGTESYSTASKYGRNASDYLAGVQSMSQSGFYGETGKGMAEQSLLAQSAGDMAQDIADKYVIATNAAYKFNGEASKINEVLDGQNSISNRNSVALEDMATAMSEAGTVASSYNVAIEDLSAMIGTMESVTKSGGSEVGNSIKSLLINLQNVTSDKITNTLTKANASMTEMVNGAEKLRNPISIIRDLAKTFNQLDEDDPLRAEILTNVGGKYQATKLAALLQNMEMFDKMLVDYSEGSGSALEEANKSATNLTGTLNELSNSWTELINSMINSDDLKAGVNLLNSIIQGATKLVSVLTPLGTIGAGAGLFAGIRNVGGLKYREFYFVNVFVNEYA